MLRIGTVSMRALGLGVPDGAAIETRRQSAGKLLVFVLAFALSILAALSCVLLRGHPVKARIGSGKWPRESLGRSTAV